MEGSLHTASPHLVQKNLFKKSGRWSGTKQAGILDQKKPEQSFTLMCIWNVGQKNQANIRAIQGHSTIVVKEKSISFKKVEESYALFLCRLGKSKNEESLISGGIVPGGLEK